MKIIGVTGNYGSNSDLHRDAFIVPDSSLVKGGKPIFLPDTEKPFGVSLSLALSVCKVGKKIAPRFASRYFNALSIAMNFIDIEAWNESIANGLSWAWARAYDSSMAIGEFISTDQMTTDDIAFTVRIANKEYTWHAKTMKTNIEDTLSWISQRFTLKMGDLLLIGLSPDFINVNIDQHVEGIINNKKILEFNIK